MQKVRSLDWKTILNSSALVSLLSLTGGTLYFSKGVYDRVIKIETLKSSDHSEWIQMKNELSINSITDKQEHAELFRDYRELKDMGTTSISDITILQQQMQVVNQKLHLK